MSKHRRVAVVGAGIAGLAAAHALSRNAPDIETVLIERDRRLGGKIVTERVGGFVIEGGPDSFLSSKPRGLGLAIELELESRLEGPNERMRRTFVLQGGRLHDLPEGLSGLVPSRLEPLLDSDLFSPTGKERLQEEPAIPPRSGSDDEPLASFVRRRFGPEVYDRMIEPLMAGIYAGDGERLSLDATFPQLRRLELEYRSLMTGIAATSAQQRQNEPPRPAFLTPISGMMEIVEAVSARLAHRTRISTGTAVRWLQRHGNGYRMELDDGSVLVADAVVIAIPAHQTGLLLEGMDGALSDALSSIPHESSATVSLAYPLSALPQPLNGYGYIIPRQEGRPALASTWTSTKFRHRAPEDFALIRVFLGGAGREHVLDGSDHDLVEAARTELRATLGIVQTPALHRVYRWMQGMPQYTLGHLDRLRMIEECLQELPGIFLAGNAYRGVGIPDCILSGETAAYEAAAYLSQRPSRPSLPQLDQAIGG
ncbi:MAG TPA: protoporphyrinogen oxidase [Chloroflexota bacterium]